MITISEIRAALAAADPFERMDRLIRAELAGGRTTRQVFDAINGMLTDLRSPGLPELAEEAVFGSLDALLGRCHPDCAYPDPPAAAVAPAVRPPAGVPAPRP